MITDSHMAKAMEYVTMCDGLKTFRETRDNLLNTLSQGGTDKVRDVVLAWQDRHFNEELFINGIAVIYAEFYSEEELDQLIQWRLSPIGEKTATIGAALMNKTVELMNDMYQDHLEELESDLDRMFEEEENAHLS